MRKISKNFPTERVRDSRIYVSPSPDFFSRAVQWPRASVAARGLQPPCDLVAGRKAQFLAVKTANSTLGCCLSQVKSSCYSPNSIVHRADSALLVVLHEFMPLVRFRFW